ncbi:hypothetical protein M758_3G143500 [Ceratodon purpureus]|nr:hypothetical protein M758_3G143500 [Ceratodon purpureus]
MAGPHLVLRSAHALQRSCRFLSSSALLFSSRPPGAHPLPGADAAADADQPAPVDRSGLSNAPGPAKETAMAKHIKALIRSRGGPITVAEYMEEVLTNPSAAFHLNRDVFGTHGDFVTLPEISQMFGEMVGVWTMCLWHQMGQPEAVNLIELGPCRGMLMADLLRGTAKFKDFSQKVSVHLVECSPALRKIQRETLICVPKVGEEGKLAEDSRSPVPTNEQISQISGAPIFWHLDIEQVPRGGYPFIPSSTEC